MKINRIHSWENLTVDDAKAIQEKLADKIILTGELKQVELIAGADMAFSPDGIAYAVVVILTFPKFEVVKIYRGKEAVRFPYIPGYLSFREAPLLLKLFAQVENTPDVVMLDGQGISHPRKLGLASHIGLFLEIPTIGVAKSKLVGEYNPPGVEKGQWSWLTYHNEKIGIVLRTRTNVRPVFISPGNMISLESARRWTLKCAPKYRIPEPTRIADRLVAEFKKSDV
ncbi:deoxyribonuclease V [bacterium]|nr:MAG: deoxyribonuclease V [bacterium]